MILSFLPDLTALEDGDEAGRTLEVCYARMARGELDLQQSAGQAALALALLQGALT